MNSTSTLVLVIPEQIALNRVGLKKTLVEGKYNGIQCDVDGPARQVTLSGSEVHLNDAAAVFLELFEQTAIATPRVTRKAPTSGNRSFVALNPDATYWRFVPTHINVSDVNTSFFPFELERSPMKNDLQHEVLPSDSRSQPSRWKFLGELNDQYIMSAADELNNSQHRGSFKLKAVFGRKLFSCKTLESEALYHVDTLRGHRPSDRFRNRWSNICDVDGPELKALLSTLRAAKAKLGITPRKEEIAVHLKPFGRSRNGAIKIKYLRSNGEWSYKSTKHSGGCVFAHDISLADRVNFRMRAYHKSQQVSSDDSRAQELQSAVLIQEPKHGDSIFSSLVTLSKDARASIEWLIIKSVTVVPLYGIMFRMIQLGAGELVLEALVPEPSEMPLGEQFKLLVEKLQEIVTQSGDDDDKSGLANAQLP